MTHSRNDAVEIWPKRGGSSGSSNNPEKCFFSSLVLLFHFLGYPQPTVQWLQNGKPVAESSRVSVEQEEDGLCALVLADLSSSDSGIYTCKASNKLGEAMCSAKLRVEM